VGKVTGYGEVSDNVFSYNRKRVVIPMKNSINTNIARKRASCQKVPL